jgi:hypothetical protein
MISRRALEVLTATLTGMFGVAVCVSSINLGIAWGSAGVSPGTLPFCTGAIITGGSLFNLISGLLASREVAISPDQMKRLAGLFLPALAYIAAIPLLGMYVASAAYIFGVLVIQHRTSLARGLTMTAAVTATLYFLFEATFRVYLPRGVLGNALGF